MSDYIHELAKNLGRLSWAVDELLHIVDQRVSVDGLSDSEKRTIARARELADQARPGGAR